MIIGRIGTTSPDGVTIVYDANSEDVFEMRIPKIPVGTEITQDEKGDWKIVFSDGMAKETINRLMQAENFYYHTRNFLPYKDYEYIQSKFPTSCAKQFESNPFFLSDVTRENCDIPICAIPIIDAAISLSSFEDRLREMKYIIRYCLERNESTGNTWIEYETLNKQVKKTLSSTGHPLLSGDISAYLRFYKDDFYFEEARDILESKVALKSTYIRESLIYRTIKFADSLSNPFPLYNPLAEEDLSTEQNNAVKNLPTMGGHISILTGGPGTGKTTILRAMVTKLTNQYPDLNIHLLSPTGRAAKRIQEVFGEQEITVSTIHKFLGYGHTLTRRELKIIHSADIVIIDESSMIDLDIFEKLLSMLNIERTKIILVGDVDQLPSIGAGNILSDLISLGVYTEHLTENYRSQGSIIGNARKINKGNFFLTEDDSFKIIETPVCVSDFLTGMDEDIDIAITPYKTSNKKGSTGLINKIVQSKRFDTPIYNDFHVGDAIIMIRTNYKQGYFNGETGVIISYLPNGDYVVAFGDRELTIKNPEDMALGYAITVHKSQGSEYDCDGICIPEFNSFITRRMLYTAVTRAKRKVKIWASKETLRKIILNNPECLRKTFLSTFSKL